MRNLKAVRMCCQSKSPVVDHPPLQPAQYLAFGARFHITTVGYAYIASIHLKMWMIECC